MLLLGNKGKCRCSFTYAQFSAYNEVKNKYYMHVLLKGGGLLCERDAEMLHLMNTKCSMYGTSLKALVKR